MQPCSAKIGLKKKIFILCYYCSYKAGRLLDYKKITLEEREEVEEEEGEAEKEEEDTTGC
jgi:hypothetical protein